MSTKSGKGMCIDSKERCFLLREYLHLFCCWAAMPGWGALPPMLWTYRSKLPIKLTYTDFYRTEEDLPKGWGGGSTCSSGNLKSLLAACVFQVFIDKLLAPKDSYIKRIVSWDECLLEGLQNLISTLCMSADGFKKFVLLCCEKIF